jgi:hypothetical protein
MGGKSFEMNCLRYRCEGYQGARQVRKCAEWERGPIRLEIVDGENALDPQLRSGISAVMRRVSVLFVRIP